jgi:type III secretory pathway lipoprotein EscJ
MDSQEINNFDENYIKKNNYDINNVSWIDRILRLVSSEKSKLLRQNETIKIKLQSSEKELETLKALNFSLKNNQIEWSKRYICMCVLMFVFLCMHLYMYLDICVYL